jgi:hypothetical protein
MEWCRRRGSNVSLPHVARKRQIFMVTFTVTGVFYQQFVPESQQQVVEKLSSLSKRIN